MATDYATSRVVWRPGAPYERGFASLAPPVFRTAFAVRGYASRPVVGRLVSMVRDYSAITQGGGSGNLTRPLVGLLHPPGRRGNRSPS